DQRLAIPLRCDRERTPHSVACITSNLDEISLRFRVRPSAACDGPVFCKSARRCRRLTEMALQKRDEPHLRSATANRSPTLLREDNVRGSVRRYMLDCPVSQGAQVHAAKQRFPRAKRNWRNGEVNLIDVSALNVLLHSLDTAADLYVLSARRFARFFQCVPDAV